VARMRYSGRRDGVPSRVLNSVGVVAAVHGVAQQWRGCPHGVDSDEGWCCRRLGVMV
jgi:hypothetical protein